MTITDTQRAADAQTAKADAEAAQDDAYAITELIQHAMQLDQDVIGARGRADRRRRALELLLAQFTKPRSRLVRCRENALRRADGAVDDEKVIEFLIAILDERTMESPERILDRLNSDRSGAQVLTPAGQVVEHLQEFADSRKKRAARIEGQAQVQPALPPGETPGHNSEAGGSLETSAEQTSEMVLRIVEAEGAEHPAQVAAMIAHGTGTPQQAGDAVRAVFGVPTDPTQLLPIVPAYDANGDGAPEPRPFGRAVVQAGSRPHGASVGAAVNGSAAHHE